MFTQNAGGSRYMMGLCALLLTALSLVLMAVGCSSASQSTSLSGKQATVLPTKQATVQAQQGKITGPVALTPTLAATALHGPTNFLLRTPLNFSAISGNAKNGGGTVTSLDKNTIKEGVTGELKHLLFAVDSQDAVMVYSASSVTPIKAQILQRTDGGTQISYTQTVNSDGSSVVIAFDGAILSNRIIVQYEQKYSPLLTSSADATDVTVTFTTYVQWVPVDQLPAAPKDGHYQFTGSSGVSLAWSASQHAVAYHVYRLIASVDQQYQLVGTVKETVYNDKSSQVMKSIRTVPGISYAVFAVGPTGVENPDNIVIPVPRQK